MANKKVKVLVAHSYDQGSLIGLLKIGFPDFEFAEGVDYARATKLAIQWKPDLVISHLLFDGFVIEGGVQTKSPFDITENDKNVRDLLRFIREAPETRHAKFVIYSAADPEKSKETCPGADGYAKTFELEALFTMIGRFFGVTARTIA